MSKQDVQEQIRAYYNSAVAKTFFGLNKEKPIFANSDYRETWYTLNWQVVSGIQEQGITKVVQGRSTLIYMNGEITELTESDVESILKPLAASQEDWRR